uniref:F-box domain-containing protein n=1 Tax=Meloidogyne enterolobii TaxID=390850 RepID=A0A6V7WZ40_MELEN|nr:unnamed protein product [Meloidogyne enterolobii]
MYNSENKNRDLQGNPFILKDKTKRKLNLPDEVKLDVLKFLSFNQLLSFQQTNYSFYCLIRLNEGILACKRLYSVKTMVVQYICNSSEEIKYYGDPKKTVEKYGIFKILLDDELLKKWQSAVDRQIPVYLSTCGTPPNNKIYTRVEERYVDYLKLPVYPKSIEEMKIVRCWLERLFICTFQHAEFKDYIFNPEMIKILFDSEKYIPTQFRAKYGTLTYRNLNIKNLLKFTLDHLIIINELGIKFKCFDKKEKCNNYILELLSNGGKNIHLIRFNIEKQALLDLIIKHIETKDCSNFISYIEIILNQDKTVIKENIIKNSRNPKILFKIYRDEMCGHILIVKKVDEEL